MWFDSWYDIARTVAVGVLAYVAVVLFLRLSGKRTLSQLNAFDFIVTVALGSTLATILLSSDVAYVEGLAGLALLVGLQYVVATASRHSRALRRLVKSEPTILVRHGEVRHDVMHKERLTMGELHQALRRSGVADLGDVAAVVLESDGSMSIIGEAAPHASALVDVAGWIESGDRTDGR